MTIKKQLEDIIKNDNTQLEKYVANTILDDVEGYGDGKFTKQDFESWLEDLNREGCQSGVISELIYYRDTNNFYDKFTDDIWDLLYQECDNSGLTVFEVIPKLDETMKAGEEQFKNLMAWFAFEVTANNILNPMIGGE